MTGIHKIITDYGGDRPYEPSQVRNDYKEFKDYTYNVKMNIMDINYLLDILNQFGDGDYITLCAKARFWKLLIDSGVHIEVKENVDHGITHERMFARPPFGCIKGKDKSSCTMNKQLGCDICRFNCIEELTLSGKSAYANPNFVGFEKICKNDDIIGTC
jgi:hypothetical protein